MKIHENLKGKTLALKALRYYIVLSIALNHYSLTRS